ncbi:MAG: hypothetical protein AAGD35_22485, partial [Actinomycetota bacterium]
FDEVDLATNRRGSLTEAQAAKVGAEFERRVRILALLAVVGPPLAIAAAVATTGDDGPSIGTIVLVTYSIVILLVLPVVAVAMWRSYGRPLRTGSVTEFTGPIRLTPKGPDVHLQFGSRLKGPRFAVSPEQASALTDGGWYTVHYTPAGSRALFHSMERALDPVDPSSSPDGDENGSEGNEEGPSTADSTEGGHDQNPSDGND